MLPKILVITPVKHILGVEKKLKKIGNVTFMDDPNTGEVLEIIEKYNAIFTNPNKSKIYLDNSVFCRAKNLKVICTASTGTNHINKEQAKEHGIKVISLTEEREVIEKITSTAEHAFALVLSSVRNIPAASQSVSNGEWNYEKFIGRQMNKMTIGVIGYGRLGSIFAGYCLSFGCKVLVYDPYKKLKEKGIEQLKELRDLISKSDIVSIHVHVNEETIELINESSLKHAKKDVLIINTSRGEVINETDAVDFLKSNTKAKIASDVLTDEINNRLKSALYKYSIGNSQVTLTPHIGGMTKDAQEIAYNHAANLLGKYFNTKN